MSKNRAPRNRTTYVSEAERRALRANILSERDQPDYPSILDKTIHGDALKCLPLIPPSSIDLLILDPPYNLNKQFNATRFSKRNLSDYSDWMRTWFVSLLRALKPTASVYICSDWSSSPAVYEVASEHLAVRNRITWEREKGRGALANWKNCSEDIWFCTVSGQYTFNIDAVRLKRRVVAPYRHNGKPKGWHENIDGQYRFTSPSNLWTDITIPFWSMPENTDHPTQKPEKLIAKLILASSNAGDVVLDPFLGSGTTSVVCKKLQRRYIGIEIDEEYCLLTEKRLALAERSKAIQGYDGVVFLERNTLTLQMQQKTRSRQAGLFHET
ncbi:MAG: DNA-methyltransferase [Candidatus Korobacteraceae bacterium]